MCFNELINSNIKIDLVDELEGIDFSCYTNEEIVALSMWINDTRKTADVFTLEEEFVGYTYYNLDILTSKVACEDAKRGMQLTKTMNLLKR